MRESMRLDAIDVSSAYRRLWFSLRSCFALSFQISLIERIGRADLKEVTRTTRSEQKKLVIGLLFRTLRRPRTERRHLAALTQPQALVRLTRAPRSPFVALSLPLPLSFGIDTARNQSRSIALENIPPKRSEKNAARPLHIEASFANCRRSAFFLQPTRWRKMLRPQTICCSKVWQLQ